MTESPGSDLSDYASDDFPDDVRGRRPGHEPTPDHEHDVPRPNKRPRLNVRAPSSPPTHATVVPPDGEAELSEDTDGSVPASPNHHPGMSQDDDYGQEQVTACKWEGCEAGDLPNMDELVRHLHDDHIGTRQKKYSCEWSDCTRKGIPHASGYALRAHMRSHTREKPFYCTLPECDRSFTRSDALAKHMRTVHETEALRPSDPVPKNHSSNPVNNKQRLRLVLNNSDKKGSQEKGSTPGSPASHLPLPNSATLPTGATSDADYTHNNITYLQDLADPNARTQVQFPPDIEFTPEELALPAPELFRVLRRQQQWAQQESENLRAQAEALEKQRKEEWEAKELILENLMEAKVVLESRRQSRKGLGMVEGFQAVLDDAAPSMQLPIHGLQPPWREPENTQPEQQERKQEPAATQAPVA